MIRVGNTEETWNIVCGYSNEERSQRGIVGVREKRLHLLFRFRGLFACVR